MSTIVDSGIHSDIYCGVTPDMNKQRGQKCIKYVEVYAVLYTARKFEDTKFFL